MQKKQNVLDFSLKRVVIINNKLISIKFNSQYKMSKKSIKHQEEGKKQLNHSIKCLNLTHTTAKLKNVIRKIKAILTKMMLHHQAPLDIKFNET